ncbi:hypothetical protein FB45DRAFT_863393 [Roridomyces roridus]|uniref:Ubiquitin-like protease family profile domain-containing protein n=1 Tax=Roridomyces roridus TaxID=1738132 RepID=A0AAD7C3F7_9AGAR|nr:hypothetical protein FB45DRAFT_863393 [Roridomyces roridus]
MADPPGIRKGLPLGSSARLQIPAEIWTGVKAAVSVESIMKGDRKRKHGHVWSTKRDQLQLFSRICSLHSSLPEEVIISELLVAVVLRRRQPYMSLVCDACPIQHRAMTESSLVLTDRANAQARRSRPTSPASSPPVDKELQPRTETEVPDVSVPCPAPLSLVTTSSGPPPPDPIDVDAIAEPGDAGAPFDVNSQPDELLNDEEWDRRALQIHYWHQFNESHRMVFKTALRRDSIEHPNLLRFVLCNDQMGLADDEVMNCFSTALTAVNSPVHYGQFFGLVPPALDFYITSTYFFTALVEAQDDVAFERAVETVFKKFDLSKMHRLFIPIHDKVRKHWLLALADFKARRLWFYDSWKPNREQWTQRSWHANEHPYVKFERILQRALKALEKRAGRENEWDLLIGVARIPYQLTAFDCGYFVQMTLLHEVYLGGVNLPDCPAILNMTGKTMVRQGRLVLGAGLVSWWSLLSLKVGESLKQRLEAALKREDAANRELAETKAKLDQLREQLDAREIKAKDGLQGSSLTSRPDDSEPRNSSKRPSLRPDGNVALALLNDMTLELSSDADFELMGSMAGWTDEAQVAAGKKLWQEEVKKGIAKNYPRLLETHRKEISKLQEELETARNSKRNRDLDRPERNISSLKTKLAAARDPESQIEREKDLDAGKQLISPLQQQLAAANLHREDALAARAEETIVVKRPDDLISNAAPVQSPDRGESKPAKSTANLKWILKEFHSVKISTSVQVQHQPTVSISTQTDDGETIAVENEQKKLQQTNEELQEAKVELQGKLEKVLSDLTAAPEEAKENLATKSERAKTEESLKIVQDELRRTRDEPQSGLSYSEGAQGLQMHVGEQMHAQTVSDLGPYSIPPWDDTYQMDTAFSTLSMGPSSIPWPASFSPQSHDAPGPASTSSLFNVGTAHILSRGSTDGPPGLPAAQSAVVMVSRPAKRPRLSTEDSFAGKSPFKFVNCAPTHLGPAQPSLPQPFPPPPAGFQSQPSPVVLPL